MTAFSDATQLPDNVTVMFRVDAIAQEPDETFILTLNPIVPLTPREGLFFRNTTQVTIVDEESKNALIAECLSARQLILLRISFCVCMYVCMSVILRNANFLYTACTGNTAHAHRRTIVVSRAQCTNMMD